MISFSTTNKLLLLKYSPDRFGDEVDWIAERLNEDGHVRISKVFNFTHDQVLENENDEWVFKLGELYKCYYVIDKGILNLSYDLRIHSSCSFSSKIFLANRGLSVFRNMNNVLSEPIIIGGTEDGSIPFAEFNVLLKQFPTHTELSHYVRSSGLFETKESELGFLIMPLCAIVGDAYRNIIHGYRFRQKAA